MEKTISRRWKLYLPTSALIATFVLFATLNQRFHSKDVWSAEWPNASDSQLNLDLGHEPAAHSQEEDNLSICLHPNIHVNRKPRTVHLEWNVTKDRRRPDGVAKEVYLINGAFPGPTIELRSGDELVVDVTNHLKGEGIAIHWHGLRIPSAMDGVVGVTQSPTPPGEQFRYRFQVPDEGTFWYHSHSELQRADGLYGALVVHKPATSASNVSELEDYNYEDERLLLVGDWYHRSAQEVLLSYTDWKNFKIEPAPDSLLIGGRGYFDCSMATKSQPVDCIGTVMPHLTLSERTRLRIVNVGGLVGFTISFTGYAMELIQVDGGHRTEAVLSEKVGVLYPGERMDVIVQRKAAEYDSTWITVSLDRENMRFPNLALTNVQQFAVSPMPSPDDRSGSLLGQTPQMISGIDLAAVKSPGDDETGLPATADQTILLFATVSYLTQYEYRAKGFINHTSWTPSSTSRPLLEMKVADWPHDPAPLFVTTEKGHWVDLVINNMDDKGHPFHLHGHSFFVLATHRPERVGAFEQYNPFAPNEHPLRGDLNMQNPLEKDVVYVPSMGYVVLRFQADNPGLWALHCHVLWHEAVGMNALIKVDERATGSEERARRRLKGER